MEVGQFTTREAARITGLSPRRIRYCARIGLLPEPVRNARQYRLSFRDLLLLKTTRRLLDSGVPLQRIRRALSVLRADDPRRGPATEVSITAAGQDVVAAASGASWHVHTGQLMLRFLARPASTASMTGRRKRGAPPPLNANQWYEQGLELEVTSPSEALDAYRRALVENPRMIEAHINLGRLLHLTGNLEEARAHYAEATDLDPLDAIPVFNLGVVLEDLDRIDEALEAYEIAVRRDPSLPDAHHNLALLYDRRGQRWEALRHLRIYRQLTDLHSGD